MGLTLARLAPPPTSTAFALESDRMPRSRLSSDPGTRLYTRSEVSGLARRRRALPSRARLHRAQDRSSLLMKTKPTTNFFICMRDLYPADVNLRFLTLKLWPVRLPPLRTV